MHPTVNITLIWKLNCINCLRTWLFWCFLTENKRLEEKGYYAYLGEKANLQVGTSKTKNTDHSDPW